MDPTKASGNGAKLALSGVASTQLVTLLTYVCHLFGLDDMPPEVANAIIGVAFALTGAIMHAFEMWAETRRCKHAKAERGITGGAPVVEPAT